MTTLPISLTPDERPLRQAQALHWVTSHGHAAVLGAHGEPYPYGPFPHLMAAGAAATYTGHPGQAFEPPAGRLWLGALSYDYGCSLQDATLPGTAGFDFFSPLYLLAWDDEGLTLQGPDPAWAWAHICAQTPEPWAIPTGQISHSLPYDAYAQGVDRILQYLREGEAYEVNFCKFEQVCLPEPPSLPGLYRALTVRSPMPFQFLYQSPGLQMAGSSPERFLRREAGRLISQPIKGTAPRGTTPEADAALAQHLRRHEKTLAENMMITDLVRNDLAQVCQPGTVAVEELFGLYTFERIHQLITTVGGACPPGPTDWPALLRATFPMGSMTGAPKQRALAMIAETEAQARGYFSGAVGYIMPDGDFDLAVVIRSLFVAGCTVSYAAGGAIVWDSTAAEEWAEADLKLEAMRHVLGTGPK